jgi:hypothetical protein
MWWFELTVDDEDMLAAFMSKVEKLPTGRPTADPILLWQKGQLLRQWTAARRAQVPLDLMDPIQIVVGVATVVFLVYRAWPHLF